MWRSSRLGRLYRIALLGMFVVSIGWLATWPVRAQVVTMPVTRVTTATPRPKQCAGDFAIHSLVQPAEQAGPHAAASLRVGVADLDGDGDLDLVLSQRNAPTSLLWNEGNLTYRSSDLADPGAHELTILDLDHDGQRDLLLINRDGAIQFWRNEGHSTFARTTLPGVTEPATGMVWSDLDGDGDLDLATVGPGGLTYYSQRDGHFFARRLAGLAGDSQLSLLDLNRDGRPDLAVGQPGQRTAQVWLRSASSWATTPLIRSLPQPTPKLADLNNDGLPDAVAAVGALDAADVMVTADLDNDGDLDVVTHTPGQAVRLLENRRCAGAALQVELHWLHAANRDALGAQVTLHTSMGAQVRRVGGDAAGAPATPTRLFWGLPPQATLQSLEVRWPDGMVSRLERLPRNAILIIERQSEPNFTLVAGP